MSSLVSTRRLPRNVKAARGRSRADGHNQASAASKSSSPAGSMRWVCAAATTRIAPHGGSLTIFEFRSEANMASGRFICDTFVAAGAKDRPIFARSASADLFQVGRAYSGREIELLSAASAVVHEADGSSVEDPAATSGPLGGRVFAFTGSLASMTRQQAADLVQRLGARVATSVAVEVTDVVAGDFPGSRLVKARALGLRIHDEHGLRALAALPAGGAS